jgi:GTP-binding protein
MRPVIAIVGRPNVGKSTLLNCLAGRRVAVVKDQPGVTRDCLFVDLKLGRRDVLLVDTGGLDVDPDDELAKSAVEKAYLAVEASDLVLFIVDAVDGLHPLDSQVANVLRKSQKPFLCVVNKCDPGTRRSELEFHELGMENLLSVSAAHNSGLVDMAERVDRMLAAAGLPFEENQAVTPFVSEPDETEGLATSAGAIVPDVLKLCLLGRPNVGKSSLANGLVGQDQQIVSSIAGTTRDAVDIPLEHKGQKFLLVDTPGVRRKSRISQKLERYSVLAALRSLERSDVAVLVLDGTEPFADQDARLLRLSHDRGRALVVAVNKCDLVPEKERKRYLKELSYGMRFVDYAKVIEVSARTGCGSKKLFSAVTRAYRSSFVRIGTGALNVLIQEAVERQSPPMIKGRRGKILYATQAAIRPPTFIIWVNDPKRIKDNYRKYLEHRFRDRFAFEGTPLKLFFRGREKKKGRRKGR